MDDPIIYRSGCGCLQRESGITERCQRHITADWQAAQALAANPVRSWWEEAA